MRWFDFRATSFNVLRGGFAVFDGKRRISILWRTLEEAERHRDRIAEIYARYGW